MRTFFLAWLVLCTACGDDSSSTDGGGSPDGGSGGDGGRMDGGADEDGGADDGGGTDGGASDGGSSDGGDPLACPGFTTPTEPCRTGAECTGPGDSCIYYGTALCGTCMKPIRTCETDPDCSGTDVCVEVPVACTCGGNATECQPACSAATCPAGTTCGTTGHCDPVPCTAGYDCGVNHRCDTTSTSADEHGCVPLSCETDDDCDCGVCIGGKCAPVLGACGPLPS